MYSLIADTAFVWSRMTVVGQRCKEAREILRRMLHNLFLKSPVSTVQCCCHSSLLPYVLPCSCIAAVPLLSHSTGSGQSETHSAQLATIPWTLPRQPCLSSAMLQLHTTATWALVHYLLYWLHRSVLQSPANSHFNNQWMHLSLYLPTPAEHAGMSVQTLQQQDMPSLCHVCPYRLMTSIYDC